MFRYFIFLVVFLLSGTAYILAADKDKPLEGGNYLVQESKVSSVISEEKEIFFVGGDAVLSANEPLVFEGVGRFKITAYSSTVGQTDDTPFIMASGKHVYDGAVAANFLPLGAKVKFPDLYGEKIFTVEDRMHSRFQDRIDIWFETKTEARNFGMKYIEVEVAK